jgi:hypothetical protein
MKYALISVTPRSRATFDSETPLGVSLRQLGGLLKAANCEVTVIAENLDGLSCCYNQAIQEIRDAGVERVVLVHDDVQLDDGLLFDKLDQAFCKYDIVGVAGARSLSVNTRQIAWWNCVNTHKAGWITHPIYDRQDQGCYLEYYGPAPMPCVVLDGVLMAARVDRLRDKPFDEQFTFDFYDLDFTLSHHLDGCNVGVLPLALTHFSKGAGHRTKRFKEAQERFRHKYGGRYQPLNLSKKWWMLRTLLLGKGKVIPNPRGEFTVTQRGVV